MSAFHARILASDTLFFDGDCEFMVVQPVGGPLRTAAVSAGLVKVEAGEVMLLVSTAERPEDIDVNRARRAEDAAKEALLQKKSMQEHRNAEAQLARAISRLRIKEHWNSRR